MSQVLKYSMNVGERASWKTLATIRNSELYISRHKLQKSRGFLKDKGRIMV